MKPFCLLANPQSYRPLDWDLTRDRKARLEWLDLFETVFEKILSHARREYGAEADGRIQDAYAEFNGLLRALRTDPSVLPVKQLNLLELDRARDAVLRKHGLPDPYASAKRRENEAALKRYPDVVRQLHAGPRNARWLKLIKSVFAGNIFDLGSKATLHLADNPGDFMATLARVKPRPWFIDDFDLLRQVLRRRERSPWFKAVAFADNAGSDVILGLLPLLRELAIGGTRVVLAANEVPSLNDITATELHQLLPRLCEADRLLDHICREGMLVCVSTGTDLPVLDFSAVSDELNDAARGADLVLLEGMGRAVETNLHARFRADVLRLALVKNETVARHIGAEIFDCVCGYTRLPR